MMQEEIDLSSKKRVLKEILREETPEKWKKTLAESLKLEIKELEKKITLFYKEKKD